MHPLYGSLPVPYVPLRATRGAIIAHTGILNYAPPHCKTSQYSKTLIPTSVSLFDDRADPVFDGVGLAGFKSRANAFSMA